jgi:hypothetical protein
MWIDHLSLTRSLLAFTYFTKLPRSSKSRLIDRVLETHGLFGGVAHSEQVRLLGFPSCKDANDCFRRNFLPCHVDIVLPNFREANQFQAKMSATTSYYFEQISVSEPLPKRCTLWTLINVLTGIDHPKYDR